MSNNSENDSSFISIPEEKPSSKLAKCIKTTVGVIVIIAFVSLIITINVYKPAKEALFELGKYLTDLGWKGYLILVLFNGCIVIPCALPYMIFEITMAMLIPSYWMAWLLSLSSKFLGCSVSYYITKHHLRDRILKKLKNSKFYQGTEVMLRKNPFQFSVIVRVIYIPVFLKNYGLAVPEFITFKIYAAAAIFDFVPESTILIYIFQKVENIHSIFEKKQGPAQTGIEIAMIILSVSAILYVIYKTRSVLKSIKEEANHLNDNQITEKLIDDDCDKVTTSESVKDEKLLNEVLINE